MRVRKSQSLRLGVAASLGLVSAVAVAAPSISYVYTSYSTAGTPTAINIAGSGLCSTAAPTACATKPTITLGGTALSVTAATATTVTAALPLVANGDYLLALTAGTTGSVTYALTVEALDAGAAGATGATGPVGAKGATGPTGTAGTAGAKGATGATGPTGAAGTSGSATVSVVSTTTGAPGSAASVTNTGTTTAAKLNFVIPQGPAGATGAVGAQGVQGPQGVQGVAGSVGPQGVQGAGGATGVTGPTGLRGVGSGLILSNGLGAVTGTFIFPTEWPPNTPTPLPYPNVPQLLIADPVNGLYAVMLQYAGVIPSSGTTIGWSVKYLVAAYDGSNPSYRSSLYWTGPTCTGIAVAQGPNVNGMGIPVAWSDGVNIYVLASTTILDQGNGPWQSLGVPGNCQNLITTAGAAGRVSVIPINSLNPPFTLGLQ